MKKVTTHRKSGAAKPVKTSAYFSSKEPRMPTNQTFSGQSKAKKK